MAYIVAEPCIKCKYTDCVLICPVMCFHEGANMVVIDPVVCIDCGACVDKCPVHAIFPEEELPEKWQEYKKINATYCKQWPMLTYIKHPMETADEFKTLAAKRDLFDPAPGTGDK
ncbi:MAG: hypothetical protein AMXMBFR84_47720 [Candidatus Hydrogenedentota bacterium]